MCVDDGYIWKNMDISGDVVIATRWLSTSRGGGYEIVLFDLTAGNSSILADQYSEVGDVAISDDWVAWKVIPEDGDIGPGNGLGSPDYTIVHNLRTGEEFKPGEPGLTPSSSKRPLASLEESVGRIAARARSRDRPHLHPAA
ncbi:MAG: hypothetical protein R2851_13120 [Caldilineaceae bacterium]